MKVKPQKCCYPKCIECPYKDCRYDRLEVDDYTESNKRDYELFEFETGKKLHKSLDSEYRQGRQNAYNRIHTKKRNRTEYNRKYYEKYKEQIKEKNKQKYNKEKNTKKCKKYRKKHSKNVKDYQKNYYLMNREKKLLQAKQRYYDKKEIADGGTL